MMTGGLCLVCVETSELSHITLIVLNCEIRKLSIVFWTECFMECYAYKGLKGQQLQRSCHLLRRPRLQTFIRFAFFGLETT